MSKPIIEWGTAGQALEIESGDRAVIVPFPGGALVAGIDGLGHGPEAAYASHVAAGVLEEYPDRPVTELIERCHEAMRKTRGAVMTLASFHAQGSASLTWVGVGNVDAALHRAARQGTQGREVLASRGGVVGYQIPTLRPVTVPVWPGDTLTMISDGVRGDFSIEASQVHEPQALADALLAAHAKGTDDALVIVARYLGGGQ